MSVQLRFQLDQDDVCNIYSEWKSSEQFFITGYEGIPQNLVLNVFFAMGVILGFSFARRLLWNYGRIAVIERALKKENANAMPNSETVPDENPDKDSDEDNSNQAENDPRYDDAQLGDTGLFSWIRITFTLSEDFIYAKCGVDAVLYLRYQRHLIFLSLVICICSICIVFPIHINGDQLREGISFQPSSFGQTTLANLAPDSPLVWVHTILAFLYFCASVVIMRHFTRSLRPESKDHELSHKTVMIGGIQRRMCHPEKILAHIYDIYPKCYIRECTFAYDTSKLFSLDAYQDHLMTTVKHLEDIYDNTERSCQIYGKSYFLLGLCWWKFFGKKVDALDFYTQEVRKYKKMTDYERARTLGRPLGVCFVTFETEYSAERMIKDYSFSRRLIDRLVSNLGPFILDRTPQSRYGRKMRACDWSVLHAPSTTNIQWENYGLSFLPWYLKAVMVNFTVMLLALFFSTPIILIKTINYYITIRQQKVATTEPRPTGFSITAVFYEVLPTLVIWVASVTLPSLVSVSDKLVGFWTLTAENRSRLIKTYSFLITMVIILPSLGLSSILYVVGTNRVKWECIYSPTNSAFYINYITTSCFLGSTSELWRFPELFYMICCHLGKKSSYENPAVRSKTLWEFQIGSQYAWMLLVFSVFTVFSLISPLMTPLGLTYMIFKHFVDKHNIFFAYSKCRVDNSVHTTAVNIVLFSMILLLTIMFVFTNIASDEESGHGLKLLASKLFVIALAIIVFGIYVDLNGTLGTVIFQPKEVKPSRNTRDAQEAAETGGIKPRKPKLNSKKRSKVELEEKFYYQVVPRVRISPQHRYFAPLLRKDFPFVVRQPTAHPLPERFSDLLRFAELSLHHKPLFDQLIASIEVRNFTQKKHSERTVKFEEEDLPPEIPKMPRLIQRKVRFNPVVQSRRIPPPPLPEEMPKTWGDILKWNRKH